MLSVISNFSSCGGGTRTRTRSCPVDGDDSPNASCGPASPEETEECNSEVPCPLPPEWTEWGEWSGCSKSCGGGHLRSKLIDKGRRKAQTSAAPGAEFEVDPDPAYRSL